MDKNSLLRSLQENAKIQKLQSSNKPIENFKPSPPSIPRMISNMAESVVRNAKSVVAGNSLTTNSEQANSRLSICQKCEFFDKNQQRCQKCGCFMAVKTYLKAEKCPIGRW